MLRTNGYIIEHCQTNCHQAAFSWELLKELLETTLNSLDIDKVLNSKFNPLRSYHIPKICLAGCPNGCSQPLIKDFGIIGYVNPRITDIPCRACKTCVRLCQEKAITCSDGKITIDYLLCLDCGDCILACPTGTLSRGEHGWKLYLAGRVGRHPHFGELAAKTSDRQVVVNWIVKCINDYSSFSLPQERLSYFLERFKPSELAGKELLRLKTEIK